MSHYTEPHYEKSALITVDIQNGFVSKGRSHRLKVAEAVSEAVSFFRDAGRPVIHIVRIYLEDGSNADLCRREEIEDGYNRVPFGSEAAKVVPDLLQNPEVQFQWENLLRGEIQQSGKNEYIIYKPRFGAFYGTPLESFLREREIDTLVFTGFNFPNCPRSSIYEASERDFRIVALLDGISDLYDRGIEELRNIGVNWLSSGDIPEKFHK